MCLCVRNNHIPCLLSPQKDFFHTMPVNKHIYTYIYKSVLADTSFRFITLDYVYIYNEPWVYRSQLYIPSSHSTLNQIKRREEMRIAQKIIVSPSLTFIVMSTLDRTRQTNPDSIHDEILLSARICIPTAFGIHYENFQQNNYTFFWLIVIQLYFDVYILEKINQLTLLWWAN